jgi:histidine triad (HIT) family protein
MNETKDQCIFCHIIAGNVTSKKVYEDDKCLAILDINPANPGHTLVIPKEHYSIMPLVPEEEMSHLFKVAHRISAAQLSGLKADGTNLFVANGAAAGQKAPHFMIHLIPRSEGDGMNAFTLPENSISEDDQEKLRQAILGKVGEAFGQTQAELTTPAAQPKDSLPTAQADDVSTRIEPPFEEQIPPPEPMQQNMPVSEPIEIEAPPEEETAPAQTSNEPEKAFEILPPEYYEKQEAEESQKTAEEKHKRRFNLDAISHLFR